MKINEIVGPYKRKKLDEGIFSTILEWFKSKINSLFKSLGFGETKYVTIQIPSIMNEVKVSSVGYYHEWLILQALRDMFASTETPYKVSFPQANEIDTRVQEARKRYAETIPSEQPKDREKFLDAVQRSERSAPMLAEKILQDIAASEDIIFIDEIIIKHVGAEGLGTGGSGGGGGKADIRVSARKKDESSVYHLINASIKIAVGGFVTLLTTGSPALINKIFFPSQTWGTGAAAWDDLRNAIMQLPEMKADYDVFMANEAKRAELSLAKTTAKEMGDKDTAKRIEQEMITHINEIGDFIYNKLFNQIYPKHKEEINKNFLIALGLDNADSVYYTFVQAKTAKMPETHYYMSSKTSPTYKELYDKLEGQFTLSFVKSGKSTSATRQIVMFDANGVVFWRSPIQFQQSGTGTWKLFMLDLKKHMSNKETSRRY